MKPTTIPFNLDAIPTELQALTIWLIWGYQLVNGKWTKVPFIADQSRRKAATDKPKTWRSFADARRFAEQATGIGMCVVDQFSGWDLDCCRNPETGVVTPWAERVVNMINSYTEVSPSGTGLRIIVKLKRELPQGRRIRGGKERSGWEIGIYDRTSPRYLAMTGVVVDGRETIRLCDPQEFYPEFESGGLDPEPPKVIDLGRPAQVDRKANGKSNGHAGYQDKRARLIRGEWEGLYSSQSEADAALVWYIANDYNDDPELIDRAFRGSGLMRPKWDEPRPGGTYGSVTIAHCLEKKANVSRAGGELIVGQDGRPKACLANCLSMLRQSPAWAGVLAFNEFSLYATTKKPAPWQRTGGANWTDNDDTLLCEWFQRHEIVIKTNVAAEAAQVIAKESAYHPVRDYLTEHIWDGVPRIERWLKTYLGGEDTTFNRAIGERWLISAVARIFQPGCQADHTLLLEGPQGIRKSTALRTLAGDEWFTDHISDLGSKDSRIELHGKWIIEHSELDRIRRGELERVKAFLTARIDNFRLPYGRRSEAVPRSCVFAASVNDETPLTDETGNRRFWPVRCGAIDITLLSEHRDQLWAEAYAKYKAGEVWWLDSAQLNHMAKEETDKRYEAGAWDDEILAWADNPVQQKGDLSIPRTPFNSEAGRVTVVDVLLHCVGKPMDRFTRADQMSVARCLTHAGWRRRRVRQGRGLRWFYVKSEEFLG